MDLPEVSQGLPTTAPESKGTLVRGLSLLDSVLLLVGGIVGSSIFLTAKDVAGPLPHPVLFLLVWIVGGVISFFGCSAFAELGSMFPESGGQYVYLREAYGDLPAFLYGWMLFAVSNGGTIAALAVASAAYLGRIIPAISPDHIIVSAHKIILTRAHIVALILIAVVTWINVIGLRRGALLQNLATWAKFGAIGIFVLLGLAIGKGDWHHFTGHEGGSLHALMMGMGVGHLLSAFGLGLIAVFWAYDGWVYITWVAGEVKDSRRNVPLAMLLGILLVGLAYVAMNVTYVYAMRITDIAKHETIAHDAAIQLFSPAVAVWLSAMIAVSCFGAMASCILSGGRVYYAMAKDGVFFKRMAGIHPQWHTPAFSLIGQGVWAAILTLTGRYDQLYTYVTFMMVFSYILTVVGVFILRWKRPNLPRSYRCAGYPWLPATYVLISTAWMLNTIIMRPMEALAGAIIVLIGVPGYLYWKRITPNGVSLAARQ